MDNKDIIDQLKNAKLNYTPQDIEEYYKDLREKQANHLDKIKSRKSTIWRPCLHNNCEECHGTGLKSDGRTCVHMISCPCPKCSPHYL